jgi:hypothetical protein
MYNPLYLRGSMSDASQRTSVSLRGVLGHVPGTRDRRASAGCVPCGRPRPHGRWRHGRPAMPSTCPCILFEVVKNVCPRRAPDERPGLSPTRQLRRVSAKSLERRPPGTTQHTRDTSAAARATTGSYHPERFFPRPEGPGTRTCSVPCAIFFGICVERIVRRLSTPRQTRPATKTPRPDDRGLVAPSPTHRRGDRRPGGCHRPRHAPPRDARADGAPGGNAHRTHNFG